MARGIVVIDPGHGGTVEACGSSWNNARSHSGVLEKNMTLRMGFLVREALREAARRGNHDIRVIMTRENDTNLCLTARANVARQNNADLFLSIHFNGFDGRARGVETLVRPQAAGNTNHAADKAFAQRIQNAVFGAVEVHDSGTRNRGVKDQVLAVLKDHHLGDRTRACLVEIEFIDVPAVDELLNLGQNAPAVRADIASAIAGAMIDDLRRNQ